MRSNSPSRGGRLRIVVAAAVALIAAGLGAASAPGSGGPQPRASAHGPMAGARGAHAPSRCPTTIAASTGRASAITDASATVAGTVTGRGAQRYYFAFGTTRTYGMQTGSTLIRGRRKRLAVTAVLSGLTPATTYHYRLVAAGGRHCGPVHGADRTFETAPPPLPPSAETGAAGAVGQTTGTLTGSVNPQGTRTGYYFSYGPTDAYGAQTPLQSAGSGTAPTAVARALGGLSAVTTYHYRLVATNSGGTTYGADATFTTSGYYQNPVYADAPMPDPFVLDNHGNHSDYWAFGTGYLFPVLHSPDLVHWIAEGTAMTQRPGWAVSSGDSHPWAPSVIRADESCPGTTSSGCYIMYYVSVSAQLNNDCIGVATSPTPGGPYADQGPLGLASTAADTGPTATFPGMPIGCRDAGGMGNIDPSPFVDSSGQAYLYVSTNQACSGGSCTLQPTISVIPLGSDLLEASAPRVPLFGGDAGSWEASGTNAPTVEGPFMELHNGTYYLFYSGGSWQAAYGMGYATAASPTGPFTKSPANPIFSQTVTVLSPGGGDELVTGPHGGLWMMYAARAGSYTAPRTLRLDSFAWQPAATPGAADTPMISGPTSSPQTTEP